MRLPPCRHLLREQDGRGLGPHLTYGVGGIVDPSYYCGTQTIVHSYGWNANVTTTAGSRLSNNTFRVESEPTTRVWT